MTFPFDFGFVPSTLGEDGDPLDILVLMDAPVVPGCVIRARLIGAIEAKQKAKGESWERNDRLIAVAVHALSAAWRSPIIMTWKLPAARFLASTSRRWQQCCSAR